MFISIHASIHPAKFMLEEKEEIGKGHLKKHIVYLDLHIVLASYFLYIYLGFSAEIAGK